MSKKLAAKEWLALGEAAELASLKLGEPFSRDDILHFVCNLELPVCWNLHSTAGQEVAPASHVAAKTPNDLNPVDLNGVYLFSVNDLDGTQPDFLLDAVYYIDLFEESGVQAYLRGVLSGKSVPCESLDGVCVKDDEGRRYRLLEKSQIVHGNETVKRQINELASIIFDEERDKRKEFFVKEFLEGFAQNDIPKFLKNMIFRDYFQRIDSVGFGDYADDDFSRDCYTVIDRKPELTELAIKVRDLDSFISKLNGGSVEIVSKEISGKTRNAMLKTIEALSDALIEGLTVHHHSNADACIAAMKSKGINPPIKKDALAKYLKDAKKLN